MSSRVIKEHLQKLKAQKDYDTDFVVAFQECNDGNEEGSITAEKIIAVVAKRYAESKKNRA